MKIEFTTSLLPPKAILITCSSHENRCTGLVARMTGWKPTEAVIFHYDDTNPKREQNHRAIEGTLQSVAVKTTTLQFVERNAVKGLHDNMKSLHKTLRNHKDDAIVLDISVLTKRHLLMMLRWLDDEGLMDRLFIVYSEPGDYNVSKYIPLSFGLSLLQHIPGFSACPDLSRALHMVLFLGYEGDRALAVYEHLQPIQTTLVIPYPPYKEDWIGKTENLNSDLIAVVGEGQIVRVDSIDPDKTVFQVISNNSELIQLGGRSMNARAYVARFNFTGADQEKKCGVLSGGERNRLHLALTLKEEANVLLLDEPTNDIDVNTLRALEEGLENFAGCAVIISHDRWFLDRVATHILAFEGDSQVYFFEGGYSEYEENRKKRLGDETPTRIHYKKLKAG